MAAAPDDDAAAADAPKPAAGPCSTYRVDLAGRGFGDCKCGFPKSAHQASALTSEPPEKKKVHAEAAGGKDDGKAGGHDEEAEADLAMQAEVEAEAVHSCGVGPKPEEDVLKRGLLGICNALGKDGLLKFPRRPNGSPLLMRQGFFERMLRGETTLQNCAAADAAAAEADVKGLNVKQLLAIRCAHLDYMPDKTPAGVAKGSFLRMLERCTMGLLAQHLLGAEAKALSETHRTLVMRHVLLIYGADAEMKEQAAAAASHAQSEYWLLPVRGTRRYLHLGRCELCFAAPSGAVYCYRSHSGARKNIRDTLKSRVFHWQVFLLTEPGKFVQDPVATEENALRPGGRRFVRLCDTTADKVAEEAGTDVSDLGNRGGGLPKQGSEDLLGGGFLFGDFDVEKLFDDFGDDGGGSQKHAADVGNSPGANGTSPAYSNTAAATNDEDIDDFFDSLLSDDLFEGNAENAAPQSAQPAAAAAVATPAAKAEPSEASVGAEQGASAASAAAEVAKQPAAAFQPPARTETSGAPADASATAPQPTESEAEPEQPLDAVQKQLAASLQKFYQRRSGEKVGNVGRICRKFAGDGIVDLWAQLGRKYSVPPSAAVHYLAETLDPRTAVQWPQAAVPVAAQEALESLGAEVDAAKCVAALERSLDAGDCLATNALAYRHGCKAAALRPRLWRALILGIGWQDGGENSMSSTALAASANEALKQRREAYAELKQAQACASGDLGVTKDEIEADVRAAWKGEEFLDAPGIMMAITSVVMMHAKRSSKYCKGSSEVAALLLYAMLPPGAAEGKALEDAEADAFWCFSELMLEMEDSFGSDAIPHHARRLHMLLLTYDPPLASLLAEMGLATMPAMRLAGGYCTKAGFPLECCAAIWDMMLADPHRFEFSDHAVIALILQNRGDLLQRNTIGELAETLLAAPRRAHVEQLLATGHAICAFDRRCGPSIVGVGGKMEFPPRPNPGDAGAELFDGGNSRSLEDAVAAAQERLKSVWGSIRAVSAEAWEAGRGAAAETAAHAKTVTADDLDKGGEIRSALTSLWSFSGGLASQAVERARAVDLTAVRERASVVAASAASQAATAASSAATAALEVSREWRATGPEQEAEDEQGGNAIPEEEAKELAAAGPAAAASAANANGATGAQASAAETTTATRQADPEEDAPPLLVAAPSRD
eukprot:TRINITY_DN21166_c0_g2_i1.p1 TRINITY_DN21166_c0_g2~~TRINITY_DN21166_c0_g2_i1.p1  ORF type:complete len:1174 (-),score=338.26 TRINITY_DN21166_c0_g2_i1:131-3652(-)